MAKPGRPPHRGLFPVLAHNQILLLLLLSLPNCELSKPITLATEKVQPWRSSADCLVGVGIALFLCPYTDLWFVLALVVSFLFSLTIQVLLLLLLLSVRKHELSKPITSAIEKKRFLFCARKYHTGYSTISRLRVSMATDRQYLRSWTTSKWHVIPGAPFLLDFDSTLKKVLPGEGQGSLEIKLIFDGAVAITMSSPERQSPYLFYSRHHPIHGGTFQFDPSLHFSSINASHEAIAAIIQIRPILSEEHHKALTSEIADFAYKLVETARTDGFLDIKIIVRMNYTKINLPDDEIESTIEQYRCFKAAVSLEVDRTLQGSRLLQLTKEDYKRSNNQLFQYLTDLWEPESYGTCAVCLDEIGTEWMQAVELLCNHRFHMDCTRIWLRRNKSCPLCRSNLSIPKFAYQNP
ncbi:hypothetical protein COCNU_scaffold029518G000030 [Cocos nucifera]|nr:hypothetical protein [Cocos nucifera]